LRQRPQFCDEADQIVLRQCAIQIANVAGRQSRDVGVVTAIDDFSRQGRKRRRFAEQVAQTRLVRYDHRTER
jgi:hypothetical protein